MALREYQRRELAEESLQYARNGDFQSASSIRQRAYAENPPGTIGVDWENEESIWKMDQGYLQYLNHTNFSDLRNSERYIRSLKAAIFVDELFSFRNSWAVSRHIELEIEKMECPDLEEFLYRMGINFKCCTCEYIYADTVKANITYLMYQDRCKTYGYTFEPVNKYYTNGEYNIGFLPGTPKTTIDARRRLLQRYAQFEDMGQYGIETFPKTFDTFQKHMIKRSEKYQKWMQQYSVLQDE